MQGTIRFQNHWSVSCARSVSALMLREMGTTYGRSLGGYVWAILEPVAGIALLTFIFSLAFRAPPLGDSFPLFYASGLLPFTIYVQYYTKLMVAIWYSKPLLQYPVISFIDTILSRFILTTITQSLVFIAVVFGVLLFDAPDVAVDISMIALALSMTAVLGAGVGVLNCLLISIAPVWQRVWNVLHRPMFIISGIFFLLESIPEPYRSILWFNPVIHIVGVMRHAFYPSYDAAYASPVYVFGFGLICLVCGLFFLKRWHKDFLYL